VLCLLPSLPLSLLACWLSPSVAATQTMMTTMMKTITKMVHHHLQQRAQAALHLAQAALHLAQAALHLAQAALHLAQVGLRQRLCLRWNLKQSPKRTHHGWQITVWTMMVQSGLKMKTAHGTTAKRMRPNGLNGLNEARL
jgi:hypothetical protein